METHSALLHTTKCFIELCPYLLNNLQFDCVLLGKMQTDNLEARFGLYRRMSGSNYHISVQQVFESERKLKGLSLLRIVSRSRGTLEIKEIVTQCNETEETVTLEPNIIEEILYQCMEVEIEREVLQTIVYISGYAARKTFYAVCKKNRCKRCYTFLMTEREIVVETSDYGDFVQYIQNLDMGGLKYPSDTVLNVGITAYRIFTSIISSECEDWFLMQQNQFCTLATLFIEGVKLDDFLPLTVNEPCECGVTRMALLRSICRKWANIFLNNYTKNKQNELAEKAAQKNQNRTFQRKLKTLSK